MRVLLDARHAGHDVRGQIEHTLERAGRYGGQRRSLCFPFVFLTETNLTGERPFHTRTQEEPVNDTDPAPHYTNWRRLKKTQYDPVPLNTATTVFNRIAISPVMDQS